MRTPIKADVAAAQVVMPSILRLRLTWTLVAVLAAPQGFGQPAPDNHDTVPYRFNSTHYSLTRGESALRIVHFVEHFGSQWIRIRFGETQLRAGSRLVLTSLADGQSQTFDAGMLAEWSGNSGCYNGDGIEVALFVAPADQDVYYTIDAIDIPRTSGVGGGLPDSARTQCGADDDREASNHAAVARMSFPSCTAWLTSNAAFLTAGHCTISPASLIEFNVPASFPNGIPQRAAMADQYPVIVANTSFSNSGPGQDWRILQVGRSAATGLLPYQAQNSFIRLTNRIPQTIRVTGCGLDFSPAGCVPAANCPMGIPPSAPGCRCAINDATCGLPANPFIDDCNSSNLTQQTGAGPFAGVGSPFETGFTLFHRADSEPANSGSPMLYDDAPNSVNGYGIGIHTHGGCTADGGRNAGTCFRLALLADRLHHWLAFGAPVHYVDNGHADCDNSFIDYTLYDPACRAVDGVNSPPAGCLIRFTPGEYREAFPLINSSMTLQAPLGAVLLSQP